MEQTYIVAIEKREDGSYIAYNKDDKQNTIIGTGDTVAEAKEDYENSLEEVIETFEEGKVPEFYKMTPVYKFDITSLFDYYSCLKIGGIAKLAGINENLMRQYKMGNTYISELQLSKIEKAINELGLELSKLKLV